MGFYFLTFYLKDVWILTGEHLILFPGFRTMFVKITRKSWLFQIVVHGFEINHAFFALLGCLSDIIRAFITRNRATHSFNLKTTIM